jgi:hypothetical protein
VRGKAAILRLAPLLKDLAERSGQAGAMHWLGYFLSGRGAFWKRPYVVLVLNRPVKLKDVTSQDVDGAMLLYELSILGLGSRAFATDDWEATRTVIAPHDRRPAVAAKVIDCLLERGAQIVLTSYDGPSMPVEETGRMIRRKGVLWAEHTRELKKGLALASDYEEMLARFGKATRFNLRYYRRRLNLKTEVEFLGDALPAVTRVDLLALNERSLFPVPEAECDRRLRALRERDSFLIGLREKNGEWLSLLGGWRHAGATVMLFQMNTANRSKDSIGTVMRSYFLESEIARGTKHLSIYHGTKHSMANAFATVSVRDVIVRRKTLHSRVLQRLAARIDSPAHDGDPEFYRGSTTFLASVLANRAAKWHKTPGSPQPRVLRHLAALAKDESTRGRRGG